MVRKLGIQGYIKPTEKRMGANEKLRKKVLRLNPNMNQSVRITEKKISSGGICEFSTYGSQPFTDSDVISDL